MIGNKTKLSIPQGLTHVTQWVDENGNYVISQFCSRGRIIVNKGATGCGFTSWCLWSPIDTILVSPRTMLIRDKLDDKQDKPVDYEYYYFNREVVKNKQKDITELEHEFTVYLQNRTNDGKPLKILVTYDSFVNLADMMERFGMDLNGFCITIDESHCLVKDVKLKENSSEPVIPRMLERLFCYPNLLFISATPIVDYIQYIPEFRGNEVLYYELEWSNAMAITYKNRKVRSSLQAFDEIYDHWVKHTDPNGVHVFDEYYQGQTATYSYEAVIFLNSVKDICSILQKYIKKDGIIKPTDVTVICRDSGVNEAKLHRVDSSLNVTVRIPKKGEYHRTWTFVTRTAFEGSDFCSLSASTYVITNYNISCLCLDIASDIPQIIGRQRLEENPFRCKVTIYYTNKDDFDDEEYEKMQAEKDLETSNQISLWANACDDLKETALKNLEKLIAGDPNANDVRIINGQPQYTELLRIAEDYSRDIFLNHAKWYVIQSTQCKQYSQPIKDLLTHLQQPSASATKISCICQCVMSGQNPQDVYEMLFREGFSYIAYYFNQLPLDRIIANGYNTTKMDNEINSRQQSNVVAAKVAEKFKEKKIYSSKEAKSALQEVYNSMNLNQTAKATDLLQLIPGCTKKKVKGLEYYVIP